MALTVVVQGVLEVVKVEEFVSSLADEVERILEQRHETLEWNQDMGRHTASLEISIEDQSGKVKTSYTVGGFSWKCGIIIKSKFQRKHFNKPSPSGCSV